MDIPFEVTETENEYTMKSLKKGLLVMLLLLSVMTLFAQNTQQGFAYQGFAISNTDNTPFQNTEIIVRVTIRYSSLTDPVFVEEHQVKTDYFGVYHFIIGNSSTSKNKEFNKINFHSPDYNNYAIVTEIREAIGGEFFNQWSSSFESVPYAIVAENGVPPGTINAFVGNVADVPKGWLLCDGSSVSQEDFPALYSIIGNGWGADGTGYFRLPDLANQFLRGVDEGVGKDPDAITRTKKFDGGGTGDKVGTYQDWATAVPTTPFVSAQAGAHVHNYNQRSYIGEEPSYGVNETPSSNNLNTIATVSTLTPLSGKHTHVVSGGDSETSAVNKKVNYIIKY